MRMHENTYFQKMYEVCCEQQKIQNAHEAEKEEIKEKYGWDSQLMKDWYAKDEEIKKAFPYSAGQMKAYWTYDRNETEELEFSDFCWEENIPDFIEALRSAGIKSFVFTNQSTAVMENIHGFIKAGCTMEGACTLEKKSRFFGAEGTEQVLGLRFKIN